MQGVLYESGSELDRPRPVLGATALFSSEGEKPYYFDAILLTFPKCVARDSVEHICIKFRGIGIMRQNKR